MQQDHVNELIRDLKFEWGEAGGFFFDLRDRKFNRIAFDRIKSISFEDEPLISREIVALIWSIPFFVEHNSHNISGIDRESLGAIKNELYNLIEDKLEN